MHFAFKIAALAPVLKPDCSGYLPVAKALCSMSEKQGYHSHRQ